MATNGKYTGNRYPTIAPAASLVLFLNITGVTIRENINIPPTHIERERLYII